MTKAAGAGLAEGNRAPELSGADDLAALTAALPADAAWHWIAVRAPAVPPEAFLAGAPPGPVLLWAPPDDTTFAGIGVAEVVTGHRHDRMQQVLERGTALLSTVQSQGDPGAPAPRCFGGFAFREGGAASDPWTDFGDARFVLPRLTYCRRGPLAWLVLVVRPADPEREAWLTRAREGLKRLRAGAHVARPAPGAIEREDLPLESWRVLVETAKDAIDREDLAKVVTARRSDVQFDGPVDPVDVLCRLAVGAAECTRFAFRFGEATFLGASPEKLVRRRGTSAETEALAGSIRASGTESSEALLRSEKDRSEHALVVHEITRLLAPVAARVDHPAEPEARTFRHIQHLRTPIRALLTSPLHVLHLVARLHPTPAVGGVPTRDALAWIARHEHLDRGWYAGPVGWFDATGDGDFAVALRSGVLRGSRATLYAGGGVVRGSDADGEYAETSLKLAALASALGLR
jgi:isochorismate synthase